MGKISSKTKAPNPSRTPPPTLKKYLLEEAGYKCANPGCSNRLIEIHHIKEWCIYYTHDKAHMIAVCPACHDTITRGNLRIDDETLYRWKNITRGELNHDHIYVERGSPVRMLFGSITVESVLGLCWLLGTSVLRKRLVFRTDVPSSQHSSPTASCRCKRCLIRMTVQV